MGQGQEYYCPFAGEVCQGGTVNTHEGLKKCQFWYAEGPGRCWLLPALGGLAALNEIQGMLQSLASRGGEGDRRI